MASAPRPTQLKLLSKSKLLELTYSTDEHYQLSYEFLRVHSPSAEVRGHGPGSAVLQTGKKEVDISKVEAAGNYAIKITFSDGHDSGIYTWDYLYDLCENKSRYWDHYLDQLKAANESR